MNKKMLTVILSVVLVGAFFLDWGGGKSAFDGVKDQGGNWKSYLTLIIPLSGVLLLLGALNKGNYLLGRKVLCWLPLLTILYVHVIKPLIDDKAIGDIFKMLGKGWGIGLWVTIAASLVLALYNPKSK
jgi:hypothetical protein